MRLVSVILLLVLAGLQYKLWLGEGSILQRKELEKKIAYQKKTNDALQTRNRAIEEDIVELKSGDQALEEQARYELGMVKKDETYYQFVD
jgi:cell division protein FtsB